MNKIKNTTGIYLNCINRDIWDEFKNMTRLKHGKLHTVLGQEVEKALIYYMKSEHIKQDSIQINKKQINKKEQNFAKIAEKLLEYNIISYKTLTNVIIKVANISDDRTIKAYKKSFLAMGWISEIKKLSRQEKIYKIDHDMINVTLVRYEEKYDIVFNF